jgi:hypothetical protein
MQRPPLPEASLQGPQLTDLKRPWVSTLKLFEHRLRLQLAVRLLGGQNFILWRADGSVFVVFATGGSGRSWPSI